MAESSNGAATNNESNSKLSKSGQIPEPQDPKSENNVLRPILIEDYSYEEIPESLLNLIQYFESRSTSPPRISILIGLIFLLMAEYGFVPDDYVCSDTSFGFNLQRTIALSKCFPYDACFHKRNYCMKLIWPNLRQSVVTLTFVCASDDLIVNCFAQGIESGYFNVMLDPLKYFTSSSTDLSKVKFQHLDQLSRSIKTDIAFPAKHTILKRNGLIMACLEDLPLEILIMIMKKLPLVDLDRFGKVNGKFAYITRDLFMKLGKKMQ